MEQETESGVDFSFDLLRYVNGDEECQLWNSQQEPMLDPALITQIVLSPTQSTTSFGNNKEVSATSPVATNQNLKQFNGNNDSSSSLASDYSNPFGEER